MTRTQFIADNPILRVLSERGIEVKNKMAKCPFHEDKQASMSVDQDKGVFHCHGCKASGSVIDLLAKFSHLDPKDYIREHGINGDAQQAQPKPAATARQSGKVVKTYSYKNALGREVYQVCRMEPKSFRQRHQGADGEWIWNMDGVERVLYRLPDVLGAELVAIAEGEKDADTLTQLGFCGTCNVGGAGKWLDGYTEALAGKDVILFGDADDAGRKHVDALFDALGGKVRSARIVFMPDGHKDVSDYAGTFKTDAEAKAAIDALIAQAQRFDKALRLPLYSMVELEAVYTTQIRALESDSFSLGKWLPRLRAIRPLVPGELVMIVAGTGVGKTALLSSLAISARPLPTVFFQFELPPELMFERLVAAAIGHRCDEVADSYSRGDEVGDVALRHHFHHLLVCGEPRLTVDKLESLINKADLKLGQRPKLVLLDYVQLVPGKGTNRYEKASQVAEDLKTLAKATRTVIVIASQVARPGNEDSPEVTLHSAKDSGSLENSCGLVLGAWRDLKSPETLHLRILKATRGGAGLHIECNFDGPRMIITEAAPS